MNFIPNSTPSSALVPVSWVGLVGEAPGDYSGISVSGAGDVNNDGFDDIIIGAYGRGSSAGESYLILQPLVRTETLTETITEFDTTTDTTTETETQETTSVETSLVTTTESYTTTEFDTTTDTTIELGTTSIEHTDTVTKTDQAAFGILGSIAGVGIMVAIFTHRKSKR